MVKHLIKAYKKGICHCKCKLAFASIESQLSCPWCGCGWLFTCTRCGLAFTYAKVVDLPDDYRAVAGQLLVRRFGQVMDAELIEEASEDLKRRIEGFDVGDRVVYLDGHHLKLSSEPVAIYGRHSEHHFDVSPHWQELRVAGRLKRELSDPRYWQRTKLPEILIIAGANGAGKTSFAREYLRDRPDLAFVNADEMAKDLEEGPHRDLAAGRRVLTAIDRYISERKSFALETTLATRQYAPKMREWRRGGYNIGLIYLKLPSVQASLERVRRRVAAGGHAIPEVAIVRRFDKSWRYFEELYKPLVQEWYVWESLEGQFVPLMSRDGTFEMVRDKKADEAATAHS
jgi:predicted ABC-type ATPase